MGFDGQANQYSPPSPTIGLRGKNKKYIVHLGELLVELLLNRRENNQVYTETGLCGAAGCELV